MKAWQGRTAVLITLLLTAATVDSTASLSDTAVHVPPNYYSFTPPPVGQSYVDPVFGETVIRGTDALNMGGPGPFEFLSTEYSSSSVANANDTYVRVVDSNGGQHLFSLPDFTYFRRVHLSSSSPSDYWWHATNPNLLYAVPGNRLQVYDIATNQATTVHTFTQFGNVSGMGQSEPSRDGNRLVLHGKSPTSGPEQLLVYEFSSDSVIASIDIPTIPGFKEASITPSGGSVIVQARPNAAGHFEVWDVNVGAGTLTQRIVFPDGKGHYDQALGPDGKDYLIMGEQIFKNTLYRYSLEDGTRTELLHFGWQPLVLDNWFSANSMHLDGWIYVSTSVYQAANPDPNQTWMPYADEILRVRWDGSAIERLAHNRTLTTGYWNTPRATVSTSGRYVFWASNYRRNHVPNASDNYADVYFMDLGPTGGPSGLLLDGLGGLHHVGYANTPLDPPTPYFYWDAAVDVEIAPTGYYVLDSLGGLYAGGGAPAINPTTPYFAFPIAQDLELLPGGGVYVLDGFGGVNPGGGASVSIPSIFFGWDIGTDLELTSNGGFYVLDGWGGLHSGNGAPSVWGLTPFFGWDVAVDLEMAPGGGFYVLDAMGGVNWGGGAPPVTWIYWGQKFARDMELAPGGGYYVLDAHGSIHPVGGAEPITIGAHHFGWNIARDFELR